MKTASGRCAAFASSSTPSRVTNACRVCTSTEAVAPTRCARDTTCSRSAESRMGSSSTTCVRNERSRPCDAWRVRQSTGTSSRAWATRVASSRGPRYQRGACHLPHLAHLRSTTRTRVSVSPGGRSGARYPSAVSKSPASAAARQCAEPRASHSACDGRRAPAPSLKSMTSSSPGAQARQSWAQRWASSSCAPAGADCARRTRTTRSGSTSTRLPNADRAAASKGPPGTSGSCAPK
mmetsp:Transcript_19651/g.58436  ORF Transcript_19651/g.58436 Transcript_19651/m.58436 type:complete len:236 (-) Transcript_19651:1903-2610(-)